MTFPSVTTMSKYVEKFRTLQLAIKQNGGLLGSYLSWYRTEEIKYGNLVGTDKDGNEYFENKAYFIGRSRWVKYSDKVGMDYDGSQIPAEWHMWIHYIADEPPTVLAPVQRKWMKEHYGNMSGTSQEYVPYSTTRPKIEAWQPPAAK